MLHFKITLFPSLSKEDQILGFFWSRSCGIVILFSAATKIKYRSISAINKSWGYDLNLALHEDEWGRISESFE